MHKLNIFSVLVVLSFFHVSVISCKPKDYCDQKYLTKCEEETQKIHMGCINSTAKIGESIKLIENERVSITKYFNDIRNQIASDQNISNMHELTWNEEYEYLAEQAIEKLTTTEVGCYWTESSKVVPAELISAKAAINVGGIWRITVANGASFAYNTFIPPLSEAEFSELNKINYLLGDDEKNHTLSKSISSLHDPLSNLIGCSWMQTHNTTYDFTQIRCAINGRPRFNLSSYIGVPCSLCESKKCSNIYTNLCSSSNKFGISFWLVCFLVFLAFDKLFK